MSTVGVRRRGGFSAQCRQMTGAYFYLMNLEWVCGSRGLVHLSLYSMDCKRLICSKQSRESVSSGGVSCGHKARSQACDHCMGLATPSLRTNDRAVKLRRFSF